MKISEILYMIAGILILLATIFALIFIWNDNTLHLKLFATAVILAFLFGLIAKSVNDET